MLECPRSLSTHLPPAGAHLTASTAHGPGGLQRQWWVWPPCSGATAEHGTCCLSESGCGWRGRPRSFLVGAWINPLRPGAPASPAAALASQGEAKQTVSCPPDVPRKAAPPSIPAGRGNQLRLFQSGHRKKTSGDKKHLQVLSFYYTVLLSYFSI